MATGVEFVTRKSFENDSISIVRESSITSLPGSNWSWKHLMDQFKLKKAEHLFRKYQCRLQHALFMVALMLHLLFGISSMIIIITHSSLTDQMPNCIVSLVIKCGGLSISLAIFILAYREAWFRSDLIRIGVSCIVIFAMVCTEHGTSLYDLITGKGSEVGLRITSYIIITAYVMLPFPRMYQAMIGGTSVIIFELTLTGLSSMAKDGSVETRRMVVDTIINVIAAAVGVYIRFMMEFTNRRAFLDRRECFESKFHLDHENEQEDHLLLSVLPRHISGKVRHDIREAIRHIDQSPLPQRPFTELYVEKHTNVSILYADIVNSMLLTASLNVSELVETLNELFGRFDECAEIYKCMRIKLLGDCYYCVSGVAMEDPDHADHCVQMGLAIIEVIRSFREESRVNVDMRIGVHSGNILSGLIGLRKWQFDIWSRDVTIASKMEQSGRPGCIHITQATKDLLKGSYNIKAVQGLQYDNNRNDVNTQSYLISPEPIFNQISRRDSLYISHIEDRLKVFFGKSSTRSTSSLQKIKLRNKKLSETNEILSSRRRTVLGCSLSKYHRMVDQVNHFMEDAIYTMALSKTDKWFRPEGIQPLLLTFEDKSLGKPYMEQPDPLFKYYLFCVLVLFIGMATIHFLTMPKNDALLAAFLVALVIIVLGIFLSWTNYIWTLLMKYMKKIPESRLIKPPKLSEIINTKFLVRMFLCFIICSVMLGSSMIGVGICSIKHENVTSINGTSISSSFSAVDQNYLACAYPWYFTQCAALAMMAASLFLRINYLLKFLVNGVAFITFSVMIMTKNYDVFQHGKLQLSDWKGLNIPIGLEHCLALAVTFITFHVLDRQVEYICRLDYLWNRRLQEEQNETKMMKLVNRMLLQNILPFHVAQYYLEKESMKLEVDLYHEEYTNVAVMFASIPNFVEFYSENMINDHGIKCLQVLHEIICEFDKTLYEPGFLKVEKIKTIGSAYMAAVGLQPGRNSNKSSTENFRTEEDPVRNILLLTEFAISMMDILEDMNRGLFQDFRLRIGIAIGPVIAGVVGATKPQYDIWGDTVNLASRMDSTGVNNAIQVTEEVANVLIENSKYDVECRGQIFVKGKGWMTTYLVHPPEITEL